LKKLVAFDKKKFIIVIFIVYNSDQR